MLRHEIVSLLASSHQMAHPVLFRETRSRAKKHLQYQPVNELDSFDTGDLSWPATLKPTP